VWRSGREYFGLEGRAESSLYSGAACNVIVKKNRTSAHERGGGEYLDILGGKRTSSRAGERRINRGKGPSGQNSHSIALLAWVRNRKAQIRKTGGIDW